MPANEQWVFTDVVSGETATGPNSNLPTGWATVGSDCHGPLGLYIISQRMITRVNTGQATYEEVVTTPYNASSPLDSGYSLPANLPAPRV